MERTSIKELVKWKDSSRRKPLVIEGPRQVGKTLPITILVPPFCSSLGRQSVLIDGLWCPSEEQTTTTRQHFPL